MSSETLLQLSAQARVDVVLPCSESPDRVQVRQVINVFCHPLLGTPLATSLDIVEVLQIEYCKACCRLHELYPNLDTR